MSALAEPIVDVAEGDRLARRNACVLAVTQALAGGNNTVLVATAGIVGTMLAPDKGLATLPISIFVLGMWLGTLPMGMLARRLGRRTALQIGTVSGVTDRARLLPGGAPRLVRAVLHRRDVQRLLRARPTSPIVSPPPIPRASAFRPKAISWVLLGGMLAGVVGAQLVIATKDLWPPYLFAASYIGQAALALALGRRVDAAEDPQAAGRARRWATVVRCSEIARQPRFIVAVVCGVAAYSMMNMVMTSAPLAMVMCNHSVTDATLGLQWHVLGMYAPSFITGSLIGRFGIERIAALGLAIIIVAAGSGSPAMSLWHFWIGLTLLGVGWNFAFIGATTMVTECHRPNERNKVQAFNDFLVFGSMAIGSFSSGALLANFGWARGERGGVPGRAGGRRAARLGGVARASTDGLMIVGLGQSVWAK